MRFSTHDGPGIRTTVFLKGCPLACAWCHNPENWSHVPSEVYLPERCTGCGICIENCPAGALSLTARVVHTDPELCRHCARCVEVCPAEARERTVWAANVTDLVKAIERDIPFYDQSGGGVTFSGGEPLGQPEFLAALLEECGRLEIHRTVDTSGYADGRVILKAARHTDLFLYDLKIMDPAVHLAHTGVDNTRILSNLHLLSESGAQIVVRIPLIPGVNDEEENIARTGEFIAGLDRHHSVHLLPYHRTAAGKYKKLGLTYRGAPAEAPSGERVAEIARRLVAFGLTVQVGG
jgi:pyruvate formate lyase activating enzyme